MDIEDLHPLRSRVYKEHICPCLKLCIKRKANFRHVLRTVLLAEMSRLPPESVQIKQPKNETDLEDNPFLYLGYGVNAYFGTMLHLMKMMLWMSIFAMPLIIIYSGNETKALKDLPKYSMN